jgi:hypothetical protein
MPIDPPPDPRRWRALGAVSLALLVIGVDNTILNVALPTIERDLDATTGALQWIVDSYILVFAGLLLTMGTLGDRFGRRRALTAGLVLFGVSSVAPAASTSRGCSSSRGRRWAIARADHARRALHPQNVFPREEHGKAIGSWAGVFGSGLAVAPTARPAARAIRLGRRSSSCNVPLVASQSPLGRPRPRVADPARRASTLVGAAVDPIGLSALCLGDHRRARGGVVRPVDARRVRVGWRAGRRSAPGSCARSIPMLDVGSSPTRGSRPRAAR